VKIHHLRQLAEAMRTIEGVMYLLEISNHSHDRASVYAHHIRDRLSESIVADLVIAHQKINATRDSLVSEMNEEELAAYKGTIPF
jgi:hypothetical protein